MADDEVLVEVCDPECRTLTIRPEPLSRGAEGRFAETNFVFDRDARPEDGVAAVLKCKVGCFYDLKDRHRRMHDRVWDL